MSDAKADFVQNSSTEATRFNATRHGVLSRYTVLPWEDRDEYATVQNALVVEHQPSGPTEEHLVEELASILWRMRRLKLAELATHRRGLSKTLEPHSETAKAALAHLDAPDPEHVVDAIRATHADANAERADMAADEAMTREALRILEGSSGNAYDTALAALREDTQQWWAETLARNASELESNDEPFSANVLGLRRFIENEVLSWFASRAQDLDNRPLIKEQAFGESLDPDKLERLGRYEVHLDRKFERTLGMLLKLKNLRRPQLPG